MLFVFARYYRALISRNIQQNFSPSPIHEQSLNYSSVFKTTGYLKLQKLPRTTFQYTFKYVYLLIRVELSSYVVCTVLSPC